MAEKTLSKVCSCCFVATMGAVPYYKEEVVSKETGITSWEQRYICCHCKGDLTSRCKQVIASVFPRATKETMLNALKV